MKRYVTKKEEVETTSEIGEICGFTTTDGLKGYLVYSGTNSESSVILHAVLVQSGMTAPNVSCGCVSDNSFSSVEYFVRNANTVLSVCQISVRVKDIYFFDTLKEMHKWLSEIKEDYMAIVLLMVGLIMSVFSILVAATEGELRHLIGLGVGLVLMLFPVIPASNYREIPHEIISNVLEIEEKEVVFSEPMRITWTEVKANHWSYTYFTVGNKDYKVEVVR